MLIRLPLAGLPALDRVEHAVRRKGPMPWLIAAGLALGYALGADAAPASVAPPAPVLSVAPPAELAPPVEMLPPPTPVRGLDAYGSGAFGASRDDGRRQHVGLDLVADPGTAVRAPISGVVARIGAPYADDGRLRLVEVVDPTTRVSARLLYVAPHVQVGTRVAAGTVLGAAQDLRPRYPGGIVNHVHVEIRDADGHPLDPTPFMRGRRL